MSFSLTRRDWSLVAFLTALLGVAAYATSEAADAPAKGDDAVEKAAGALYEGVRVETLPNGLRVYLKPIPGSAVFTTLVAYKVGSADEDLDQTGLSHYLEHLMFKGTDKIKPGDIDRVTQRSGGANNAYTSEDMTVYHFDFASEHWEVPLKIEADRMRNLRIDEKHEFKQEKGAVINELARNEDEPWDLEQKLILPLLFGAKAPYGHPVIGERQHVKDANEKIIKAHYDKWYHPNNASLVVVGGFDPDQVLAKIKELFGPIPRTQLPERKPELATKRDKPVMEKMDSKFDQPRLLMGYNICKSGDTDAYALDVMQSVLSSGKTGRLYKKFVEGEEIASSVDASSMPGRYPGWFSFQVELLQDKSLKNAEDLLLAEIKKLQEQPISAAELKRVKQQLLASAIFGRESVHQLGDSIARGVTTNDLDYLKNYLANINKVTAADVQKVAKKYFDPQMRVVVHSVPGKKGAGAKEGRGPARITPAARQLAAADKEAGAVAPFSLKDAKRVVLPNGLTLLLFENRRLPIFSAQLLVRDTSLLEPANKNGVAALVGQLLDEGTAKHTGPQIAEAIEDVGGALTFNSSGAGLRVLSPHRKLGLGLLFECLTEPIFPKESLERQKAQTLAGIDEEEKKADARALRAYRAAIYGTHPFGRPTVGTRKTVEPLTPDDCKAFHKLAFVPNNAVLAIVGDFDSKEVIEEVKALTANWKKGDAQTPKLPVAEFPEKFSEKIITMPEAAQLHFYMGHPGIRRDNADYYKLLVMDNVLGVGPGFTDRLSAAIRDREGLAYTVRATITGDASNEPGLFTCYVGTDAENLAKVKGMFLKELNRIRDEKPTDTEVDDAKKYLLGSLPFLSTTNESIAGLLIASERYGLGLDYLDKYRKEVAAVTPADVQAAAKKYIDPKRMVLVAAGAVDDKGKPIGKLPLPKEK